MYCKLLTIVLKNIFKNKDDEENINIGYKIIKTCKAHTLQTKYPIREV